MPYRIAGIDVHKKMFAVVVADVEVEGEYQFERCRFCTTPEHLRSLAEWLLEQVVDEGNRFGDRWNDTGGRPARSEKVPVRCRGSCIWRKRSRIAGGEDGRRIFPTPSDW